MAKRRKKRRSAKKPAKKRRRSTKRRRNPSALLANPSKKRRRKRRRNPKRKYTKSRRRRRNPSVKSTFGDLMKIALPASLGGAAIGFIDSKLLGTQGFVIRTAGKIGLALALGHWGKRYLGDVGSKVAMGAVISTIGHEIGVRAGGGMVAMTKKEGVDALIEMAAEDDEVAALIEAAEEGDDVEDAIINMESEAAAQQELGTHDDEDYDMLAEAEGEGGG